MSRIPQGKVLVKAGKFEGGKLPYLNYVGQIKPADMAKIIWWGAFGSDTTGDGTVGNPYLTFDRALQAFSSLAHKWILKTDLSVYGEAGPGPYIDDPSDRVYLDPTRADDSGNGLTAATAKKNYSAAKTVLGSSGRSVIHCIGSFTLTDVIDAPTQGEIGETLTYNKAPAPFTEATHYVSGMAFQRVFRSSTGKLFFMGYGDSSPKARLYVSTDNGKTITNISSSLPSWASAGYSLDMAENASGVLVMAGRERADGSDLARSTDGGVTWSQVAINFSNGGNSFIITSIVWTGTHFVIAGHGPNGIALVFRSTDGATWTQGSISVSGGSKFYALATDGNGNIMLVGRVNATTALMCYSTNHGANWTDYSGLIGTGINTGGNLGIGCIFRSGKWWIIQDTISPAIWYSTAPTTSWSNYSFSLINPDILSGLRRFQYSWSEKYNGFLYAPSSSLDSNIYLVSDSGVSASALTIGSEYNNSAQFVFSTAGVESLVLTGREGTGALRGFIKVLNMTGASLFENVANIVISPGKKLSIANGVIASHITTQQAGTDAIELQNEVTIRSVKASCTGAKSLVTFGDKAVISRGVFKSDIVAAEINGKAISSRDIEISQSVFIGAVTMNNQGGTDKEYIQDNIIEGNFTAAAAVTVRSNIRGAVVNASGLSKISTINPIFVDTVDYELSRVALGQSIDSPLVKLSAAYSYTYNTQAYKDDLGPRRAFIALVQTSYKRAFLLPKFSGNALSEDIENVASLLKSINGVPDVSNQPQGRLEIISWVSKSVDSQVREFISYLERERNTQCELYYDFDESALDDIVVDGAHSSGTFEVNIQPKDVPVGAVLTLFGQIRYVVQRYPRSGEATKLILDDVLAGGLSDAQTIPIEQIQGAGTYVFIPEQRRQNLRVFSRRRDTYTGMKYTFARKAL